MAGRGPAPKDAANRQRTNKPEHGWSFAEGEGWQHGPVPAAPTKLLKSSRDVWATWFDSWFAWFWTPSDLPGLVVVIRLYDQVEREQFQRAGELRLQMDAYGISPKGQMERRWKRQEEEPAKQGREGGARVRHLQVVDHAAAAVADES